MDMLFSDTVNILIGGVGFFVAGFAVAFIVATLRNRSDIEGREEEYCRVLNVSINFVSELEDERQELRDRLAAELWRNRQLERRRDELAKIASDLACKVKGIRRLECQYRSAITAEPADDEASWRTSEIERQITAWEKL